MSNRASRQVLPNRRELRSIPALLVALATLLLWAVQGNAAPALPGEPCQVDPRPNRSEPEKWVWSQVCIGDVADFNAYLGGYYGEPWLDPRSPEGWTDGRKLSSAFLETILLHDPWRGTIPRQGVRNAGALFEEKVDLTEADIAHEFRPEQSRFVSGVWLRGTRFRSLMSLNGSVVAGTLLIESVNIGGHLLMGESAEFVDVILFAARIGGLLSLSDAKVTGELDMNAAIVGGHLGMMTVSDRAEFADGNRVAPVLVACSASLVPRLRARSICKHPASQILYS